MSRPESEGLYKQLAPVICASCYLGGEKFSGDAVCPNTAKKVLEFSNRAFELAAQGENDDETVSLEVFGDTVEDRKTIDTTVSRVREGFDQAIGELNEEAVKCATQVGRHAINGVDGLEPTVTYTRVELSQLLELS